MSRSVDQLLRKAIRNRKLIKFEYDGLLRVAEPHDYGIQNGIQQLLVYQVRGDSKSKRLPDWRFVKVAGIERLQILEEAFAGRRTVPSGQHKNWDELFIRVQGVDATY